MTRDKDPMMTQLQADLTDIDTNLARAEAEVARWTAEAAGLRAKREVLSDAVNRRKLDFELDMPTTKSASMPDLRAVRTRKEAILRVLQAAGEELHIEDVIAKLREGGRGPDED